ncbi:glycosyltransferase family 4 protein, partial [Vibrio splendidus]|uniref:glycosyltransferase family 4 protein n=1 Tax=Vibrio splendidus TaxID=29497 RepID=UPI001147854B
MSKIKILVDGHVLDGKPQGTCSYLAGLYGALSKFDDIEIYMLTKNYSSVVDYFGAGHLLKWVELKSDNKYKRLGYELSSIEKKIKPDFSHFQYITPVIKSSFWVNTVHDVLFMYYP